MQYGSVLEDQFDRRRLLQGGIAMAGTALAWTNAAAESVHLGNPIAPHTGLTDPHVRVFNGVAYLYGSHDAGTSNRKFTDLDWWVWQSTNLVDWRQVSILTPQSTYFRHASSQCWATDAAQHRGKYYLYFSRGPEEIGVVVSNSPVGPWHDPIGKPLIAKGSVATAARDPGILQDSDGANYIIFGTFDYYIARLNDDMTSLAETPRLIEVHHKVGPYGSGRTDDKPYLHRRGDIYYLSWGTFYAVGRSPYGPFETRGSLIHPDGCDPEFLDRANYDRSMDVAGVALGDRAIDYLNYDRHASFFEFNGQSYIVFNEQLLPGYQSFYRTICGSYVHYRDNGDIAPIELRTTGIGCYDADRGIEAANFFAISGAHVIEVPGGFAVQVTTPQAELRFSKVRHIETKTAMIIDGSISHGTLQVLVRADYRHGPVVGSAILSPGQTGVRIPIRLATAMADLYLSMNLAGSDARINHLRFI